MRHKTTLWYSTKYWDAIKRLAKWNDLSRAEIRRLREENAKMRAALETMTEYADEYYQDYCDKWRNYRQDQQEVIKNNIAQAYALIGEWGKK